MKVEQGLSGVYVLKEKATFKISKFRKNRMILFEVPEDIGEEDLKIEIEAIPQLEGYEVEVVKRFQSRNEKFNWLIDVGTFTKIILWSIKGF